MGLTKSQWFIVLFNAIYVLAFAIYYFSIGNFEFIWYIAVLLFFAILILATLKRTKFDLIILWGLSIWGFLHMCGGGVIVNGSVLYNLVLVNLFEVGGNVILKFDQFVHAFGFGVTTLVAYHLLRPYLNLERTNWKVIYPMLIVISMGLGALNEIAEFIAVVSVPDTNVGGYYNTALDLVFNTIGAILAVGLVHLRRKKGR